MIWERLVFHKHLEVGEKIFYAIRKHTVLLLKPAFETGFFGLLIPWGLYSMGWNAPLFFWIAVVWSALAWIRFLYQAFDWYADAWLITSMSIVSVEWNGFFSNTSSRIGYEDVEGVAYEIKGFWPTILRYGDITLKVMSGNNIHMKCAASPRKAELAIARYQERAMGEKEMQDSGQLKTLLSQMVAQHMRQNLK